ncbi:MAG: FAD-dependent oxidoreductase [Mesorhizobium sp.]|nr:FAD/NAD(P)-binding oxidoreductase [Mesorhizobium sp.]MBL8576512.1 FAD-dependent oxidoreductase [Mesorhizobium sp.]
MGEMTHRIVVAGGSLAGHSAVAELMALVPDADVVWVTGERHRAYSKPALSKEFMQARNEIADLMLPGIEGDLGRLRIVSESCASLDPSGQSVVLGNGERIGFDQLLVATGARARMPDILQGVGGVFPLRTLDDAVAIRESLAGKPKVVVIGGGLIGCELAASMRTLGLEVTLVEQLQSLLERPFGGAFGTYFLDLHRDNGVELIMGGMVERLAVDNGWVAGVKLADGTTIDAQLVVVGAGSEPCTHWLEGSGVAVDNGVVCDTYLATSRPAIFAAGDVARWMNPVYGIQMRVEHWTNASAQGRAAARNMAAALTGRQELRKAFGDVPYFWSDQYGQKIQMVGWHQGHDHVELDRSGEAPGPLARFYRDGRLVAAAGINAPRIVMKLRRQIEEEARALQAA